MLNKQLGLNLLLVGMALGTSWAVRGQFGHEQGAAWAGAIGALCTLLIARRQDWSDKLFKATLAAAIGWGLGGMMSYGIVVGYGNGVDFVNVFYGLSMLFVIGGLYGFIGGGLFGLALSSSEERPVNWLDLATKMVVGGIIVYFFLIYQLEWFMTPPRSELWAACLGMALALTWFLMQHNFRAALRVAVFAGLGAGFGFGFGNFLQVLGKQTDIAFNFWNVMEYSLGFFGGIGMAYGTYTSEWPQSKSTNNWNSHFWAFLTLALLIPLVIWQESFTEKRLNEVAERIGVAPYADILQIIVLAIILLATVAGYWYFFKNRKQSETTFSQKDTQLFFRSYFLIYILLSLLLTGALWSSYRIEQYLYLVNYAVILGLMGKTTPYFAPREMQAGRWGRLLLLLLAVLAVCALIAMNTHEAFEGMQRRFE
jgi:NADH:ubiquinone oxidoreductase subunit 6 (subunit J)